MKNLLIIQNYNANKGDSSVIHTMLKTISKADNALNIRVTSYNPELARDEYGIDSEEWIINFRNIKLSKSKFSKIYYFLKEFIWIVYSLIWMVFFKVDLKMPLPKFKRKTIELYMKSDVIVLPGGHFFTNLNAFPVNFSHLYGLLYAKWMGKKTMIYSQTVGPFFGKFSYVTQKMTNFIISKTDIVTLREEDSKKYCKNCNNVYITAETVFSLAIDTHISDKIEQLQQLKNKNKILVGVTIHHIYYKHFFTKKEYIELMSNIFDEIVSKYNCNILIIPMEANYHSGGDRPIAKEMKQISKGKNSIFILEGDLDPITTSSVISNTDIFIGTKTHSVVYGLKSLVPTVSISYQQKSTEFMKMFGVENNAIALEGLTKSSFMNIFSEVFYHRKKYKDREKEHYKIVKEKSLENNKFLLSLFKDTKYES